MRAQRRELTSLSQLIVKPLLDFSSVPTSGLLKLRCSPDHKWPTLMLLKRSSSGVTLGENPLPPSHRSHFFSRTNIETFSFNDGGVSTGMFRGSHQTFSWQESGGWWCRALEAHWNHNQMICQLKWSVFPLFLQWLWIAHVWRC